MLTEPLPLLFSMFLVGGVAFALFSRVLSVGKVAAIALGGPIALFIALPFLELPFGRLELLDAPFGALTLAWGGAIVAAAMFALFRRDARA